MHGNLANELESPQFSSLFVPITHQCFNQRRVLAITESLCVQAQIDIEGSNVLHIVVRQQEPRHRATDHCKLAFEGTKDLTDLD